MTSRLNLSLTKETRFQFLLHVMFYMGEGFFVGERFISRSSTGEIVTKTLHRLTQGIRVQFPRMVKFKFAFCPHFSNGMRKYFFW
jgi:hypothetical protein